MENAIRIHLFENHVFFSYTVGVKSAAVKFTSNDLDGFTIKVNGEKYRTDGSSCLVPSSVFRRGQNVVEVYCKSGEKLIVIEAIEKSGGYVLPAGIDSKRFLLDLCSRVRKAEQRAAELSQTVKELKKLEQSDDIFDIG